MKAYIHKISASDGIDCDLKAIVPDAMMRRRMSRIVRDGVIAATVCAGECQLDAIITATAYGCLADSEKFLRTLLDSNEELLSPTPFIQSTFNTIGATIALLRQDHCYNITYAHGSASFSTALLDAMMLIEEHEALHVLVGAIEELTPTLRILLERMRVDLIPPQGGALFFLLSAEEAGACAEVWVDSINTSMQRSYSDPLASAWNLYNAIDNHHCGALTIGNLNLEVRCF
ncbi:MAG: beta-ketoacyl synthase chain length factor [Alistipes sp.]